MNKRILRIFLKGKYNLLDRIHYKIQITYYCKIADKIRKRDFSPITLPHTTPDKFDDILQEANLVYFKNALKKYENTPHTDEDIQKYKTYFK